MTDMNVLASKNQNLIKGEAKIFRWGKWYNSFDVIPVPYTDYRLHLASSLMVLDDARKKRDVTDNHQLLTVENRAVLLKAAMDLFTSENVFIDGFGEQSPADFAQLLWEALGLTSELVTQWLTILNQQLLLNLSQKSTIIRKKGNCLVSLPANTFVCLDACFQPLLSGMNLVLRPSQREPFSVWRFLGCLLAVGWPAESLSFYPTDHETLAKIAPAMDEAVIYGGDKIEKLFVSNARITIHGPGRAFAIAHSISDAVVDRLINLIAGNGGRFCLGLGTILVKDSALVLGEILARLLDEIPLDSSSKFPLAVRPDVQFCERQIERLQGLMAPGDRILTQRPSLVYVGGRCIPVPTLVYLDRTQDHPLLGMEVDFPYAAIGQFNPEAAIKLKQSSRFSYEMGESC